MSDALDLAGQLFNPDSVAQVLTALVTAIYADGTLDIDFGASRKATGVVALASYTPNIGDAVEVLRRDQQSWLVLGAIRTSNTTTVNVGNNWALPYNVNPAPANPGTVANPFVVPAASTSSYRKIDGWSRPDIYQGAYTASEGSFLGYWSGCYFYGSSAFNAVKGQTCTGITITLERESSGGSGGNVPLYIAPHVHGSQPGGAPVWWAGAVNVGSLAWGGSNTFALPKSWGQAILDGKVLGFGHRYFGSSAYSIGDRHSVFANGGRLSISWA